MSCYQIIFSPTGGTQMVADIISAAWNGPVQTLDLADPQADFSRYTFRPEDLCLIAVPSFGGRVPAIAAERLAQLKGQDARAVLVAVYGNRAYDDTLLELEDIAMAGGFRCVAAVAAVAEHSLLRRFAAGRPDAADRQELQGFGRQIQSRLAQEAESAPVQVPGNRPSREYHGVPLHPQAGRRCDGCGLCAARCPVQAISAANPKLTDQGRCITCMQCVAICPQQARRTKRLLTMGAARKMKKACSGRKPNQLFL